MTALGAMFTVAVAWALGRLFFRLAGIRLRRLEHDLLAGLTGAALLSLLVFVLCAIRMARTPVFLTLGAIPLALELRHRRIPSPYAAGTLFPPLPASWRWLFAGSYGFYALLYLSNSLAPEHSPDGSTYHLGLVARYFREHGFAPITTNFYASFPQGMEMLFLFAYSLGRHAAAATVHCCFLLGLPLLILSYSRRTGQPRAGVTAALLVYLSPLAGIDGVSAYNDMALATVAFGLFYLLEIWRETVDDRLLIPIGLLSGFCFAIKYTGFIAPLYVLVVLVSRCRHGVLARATTAGAASALLVLPWLLKNWLVVRNPVSPFLNRTFPNPFVHISFEDFYRGYFANYGLPSFAPLFRMVTVTGELGGQLSPVFLLAPLGLLALRTPNGRRCLLAATVFLLPYPQNIGARFLLPALPFIALSMAFALQSRGWLQAVLVAVALPLAWPRVIDKYRAPAGGWQITTMPWQAALHVTDPEAWLRTHSPEYRMAQFINRTVPAGKKIWSTMVVAEAYTEPEVLVYYYSAASESIHDLLLTPVTGDMQPRAALRFTFPARRFSRLRLEQTKESPGTWSVSQASFFLGDHKVPAGFVTANPLPRDAALAFDHNPVTRWRSWEPARPGMYLEMSFARPEWIDRIELRYSRDQGDLHVVPRGVALDGRGAKVERAPVEAPEDLRRLATAAIKTRGIEYLLIGGGHPTAADMRADPARWGLRLAAEQDRDRIYEIQ